MNEVIIMTPTLLFCLAIVTVSFLPVWWIKGRLRSKIMVTIGILFFWGAAWSVLQNSLMLNYPRRSAYLGNLFKIGEQLPHLTPEENRRNFEALRAGGVNFSAIPKREISNQTP